MKRNLYTLVLIVIISFTGNAQTNENEIESFFGIHAGIDYNINAYKIASETIEGYTYSFYGINPRYNIGADFGLKVAKRFRPGIEINYVNVKYGIDYSSSLLDLGAAKTITNVNYFDFNFHFDYLLFTIKNFQLIASPTLKYEFVTGKSISTDYWSFLRLRHPSSIVGGAFSAIIMYNLSETFGITLAPEYTYFFHSFATGNSKPYQRVSCNFGFEFKFDQ